MIFKGDVIYFQVKASNERQLLHSQLFGRLLVHLALAALYLCRAAQILLPREPDERKSDKL